MDDNAFDLLTRRAGQLTGRRNLVKTTLGSAIALVGLGGLAAPGEARRNRKNNRSRGGFEDDSCATNDNCRKGLQCRGGRTGIAPGFPIPGGIPLPGITGSEGTCQYRQGCGGKKGDACRRNGQCCDDLVCKNDRCKPR